MKNFMKSMLILGLTVFFSQFANAVNKGDEENPTVGDEQTTEGEAPDLSEECEKPGENIIEALESNLTEAEQKSNLTDAEQKSNLTDAEQKSKEQYKTCLVDLCAGYPSKVAEIMSGTLSMEASVAVLGSTTLAAETINSAKKDNSESAKDTYRISGGINTTVAVLAGNYYSQCSSAIESCEDTCDTLAKIPQEQEQAQAHKKSCLSHQEKCGKLLVQAVTNGIGAAVQLKVADILGDKDKKKNPSPEPGAINNGPQSNSLRNSALSTSDTGSLAGGDGDARLPELNSKPVASDSEEEANTDNFAGLTGSDLKRSNKNTNGITDLNPLLSQLGNKESVEEESKAKKRKKVKSSKYSYRSSSSFSGGTHSPSSRSRGYFNKMKSKKTNRKVASNSSKKENHLRRNVFNRAGAHSNIFEKMSKVIQSYCGNIKKDQVKCY